MEMVKETGKNNNFQGTCTQKKLVEGSKTEQAFIIYKKSTK